MRLVHAGLACRSVENADRFFVELLKMTKISEKILPAALSEPLFGLERDLTMLKYEGGEVVFEVMVHPDAGSWASPLAHTCLALKDREAFAARCASAGLEVRRAIKGESEVMFVQDFDGNLYEIMEL